MTKARILTQDDWDDMSQSLDECNEQLLNCADKDHFHHWDSVDGKPELFSGLYIDLEGVPDGIDLSEIEGRIESLELWSQRQVPSIPSITINPTASTISILGIQVPTGSSFSGLVNDFNTLKNSHNALLSACKAWGWMQT